MTPFHRPVLVLLALWLVLAAGPARGQSGRYIYESGTAWLPEFSRTITATDPTAFTRATFVAVRTATLFDRAYNDGAGKDVDVPAYVYRVDYRDGATADLLVRRADFTRAEADAQAARFGRVMGQLPALLRRGVETIQVLRSDHLYAGGGKGVVITVGAMLTQYEEAGVLEEILVHEAAHAVIQEAQGPEWQRALARDGRYISKYARDNPDSEDVAETFGAYLAVVGRPGRVSASVRASVRASVAQRFAYFDRQGYDLSPLGVADAPEPEPTSDAPDAEPELTLEVSPAERTTGPVRLRVTLDAPRVVRITVWDESGRRVASLRPRTRPAGPSTTVWTPRSLAPGEYVVRAEAGDFTAEAVFTVLE